MFSTNARGPALRLEVRSHPDCLLHRPPLGHPEAPARLRAVLEGESGARRDVVLLNAGAAILVAGLAEELAEGVERARQSIDTGAARAALESLRDFTRRAGGEES